MCCCCAAQSLLGQRRRALETCCCGFRPVLARVLGERPRPAGDRLRRRALYGVVDGPEWNLGPSRLPGIEPAARRRGPRKIRWRLVTPFAPRAVRIAAIPFIAPVALTKPQPPSEEDMYQIGKLAAATCVSAAAMFLLLVLERLAPKAAWPATILFAFGTPLYSTASQALWMHGPAVFWLCAALYLLTRPGNCRLELRVLSGFALGMATLTRPAAAFFVIATVATLLLQRRWRGVCGLAIGGGVPAVLLFHYNMTHFGHPLLGGYEDDNWATTPPLWVGLSGLLIAPSRGLFVYAPALLLALPGIKALSESVEPPRLGARALLFAWLAAATATLLFYAVGTTGRADGPTDRGYCPRPCRFPAYFLPSDIKNSLTALSGRSPPSRSSRSR